MAPDPCGLPTSPLKRKNKEKRQVQFVLPICSLECYQTLRGQLLKENRVLPQFSAPTQKPPVVENCNSLLSQFLKVLFSGLLY